MEVMAVIREMVNCPHFKIIAVSVNVSTIMLHNCYKVTTKNAVPVNIQNNESILAVLFICLRVTAKKCPCYSGAKLLGKSNTV